MTAAEMAELRALVHWYAQKSSAQCSGKVKFPTFETARIGTRHRGLEPYSCSLCRQFHVGQPDRMRRLSKRTIVARKRGEEMAA